MLLTAVLAHLLPSRSPCARYEIPSCCARGSDSHITSGVDGAGARASMWKLPDDFQCLVYREEIVLRDRPDSPLDCRVHRPKFPLHRLIARSRCSLFCFRRSHHAGMQRDRCEPRCTRPEPRLTWGRRRWQPCTTWILSRFGDRPRDTPTPCSLHPLLVLSNTAMMPPSEAMSSVNRPQFGRHRIYYFLVAIILATIPCYCAGLAAVQRAPGTPSPTLEPSPTEAPPTATPTEVPPSDTPTEGPTETVTPTSTGFVPFTATPSYTPRPSDTPSPTQTDSPTPSETPVPSPTRSATPTRTPTPPPPPTSTATSTLEATLPPTEEAG